MARITLNAAETARRVARLFEAEGVPAEDAALVADSLVAAQQSGMASHGLMRVRPYIERIRRGLTNPTPRMKLRRVGTSLFRLDADGALGQVAADCALRACMEAAAEHGIAAAAINHTNHIGMAGYYTRRAAQRGFLAFACTNASPTMAPYGGIDPMLGTNPFAFSCEDGKGGSFTIDASTTAVARGKIRLRRDQGEDIPYGWAIDAEGNDTRDAGAAMEGSLLPMGGHKGFGLAMAVDILSGMLSGADLSCEAKTMFDMDAPANTGCFMQVIDLTRFVARDRFDGRMSAWIDRLKASRPRPGFDGVHIPGETWNDMTARGEENLLVQENTWKDVLALETGAFRHEHGGTT